MKTNNQELGNDEYYDLSELSPPEKVEILNNFLSALGTECVKMFKSLKLNEGFETKLINDATNEQFHLSFKKIKDNQ